MFKFITGLAETVVNVAALPVSIALDSTCIPMIVGELKNGEPIILTEKNLKVIAKSINDMGDKGHE